MNKQAVDLTTKYAAFWQVHELRCIFACTCGWTPYKYK